MNLRNLAISLLLILSVVAAKASHVIGGELTYTHLSGDDYRITLKIYRDCYNGEPPFDNPAHVSIYDAQGGLVQTVALTFPGSDTLDVVLDNPCLQAPPNVCVEEAVYTATVKLPSKPGGYHLVYQRCCRNKTILNIYDPDDIGATFESFIPERDKVQNSSPYFQQYPPIALCTDEPFKFDHSAYDPDGDSLVYTLCDPFEGASTGNPVPNPAQPPPFNAVDFKPGYSGSYPLDGAPGLSIDPVTGLLTGTPTKIGQFVVGVCVEEYRNGQLVSINKRDFQFNIVNCLSKVTAAIPSQTIYCRGLTVDFSNESENATYFHWDFGVEGIDSDTSNLPSPSYTYPDSGKYNIILIANPGYSCADTAYGEVGVYPQLTPDFIFQAGCADRPVTFTDKSVATYGSLTDWEWDFGDTTLTSSSQNTSHTYPSNGGEFDAKLIVTTDYGCRDSVTQKVVVDPVPVADFINTAACQGEEIAFTDTSFIASGYIQSWNWMFGDNTTSQLQDPTHTYAGGGTFVVTLNVESNKGCRNTYTKTVEVNPVPPSVAGADIEMCSGDTVTLGGAEVSGYTYLWTPSGGIIDSSLAEPQITLINDGNAPKTYTYKVTTTSKGCSSDDEVKVKVNPKPVADFAVPAAQCILSNSYDFQSTSTTYGGAGFVWDFGTGATPNNAANPSYTGVQYATDGMHAISLTVTENGCTDTHTDSLEVYPVIKAEFDVKTVQGCVPLLVDFSDESITGTNLEYTWEFGDNTTSNEANPQHLYDKPGTYTVKLTIKANDGCVGTASTLKPGAVNVSPKPTAKITGYPEEVTLSTPTVTFANEGTTSGTYCVVTTGDGDTIRRCDFPHTYTDTGYYTVQQIVFNENGCSDTSEMEVYVKPEFIFTLPTAFSPNGDGLNDYFTGKGIGVIEFEMIIYDRWGRLIYETTDLHRGWNGKVKNSKELAQQDVYVYKITILDIFWRPPFPNGYCNIS